MRPACRNVAVFLVAAILAAGCSGGGGAGSGDTTPPTVSATNPLDGAVDVATSVAITATFSEAMTGTSLSASTFAVMQGTTPVAGSVSHGSSTATFTPSSPLLHSTTYTATITTGAKDAAGNPIASSYSWSFSTSPQPSGWSAQAIIGAARDDFSTDIYGVDVDLNEGGTGIATWEEASDSTGAGGVWVAWYWNGGWQPAVRLTDVAVAATLPRVALNDAGGAIVAYVVKDLDAQGWARSETIWAQRWVDGAWTAAERLCVAPSADGELYASRARVGIDAQGRALVVWDERDVSLPRPDSVLGARFDGASWSAPFLVSGGDRTSAWSDVAMGSDGSAAVVWVQDTNPYDPGQSGGGPTIPNIWGRSFDGASWGDPQRIGNADLADYEGCERPSVVMDGAGSAFAIWEEHRLAQNRIVSTVREPAGPSWSTPAPLDSSSSSTDHRSFPFIATDGSGNAFAVWRSDVPGGSDVHGASARYDAAGAAWAGAELFEEGGDVTDAVAAMGGAANGWAIYSSAGMKARRQDAALGWQGVSALGPGYVSDAKANGSGMVIVGGYDGYYSSSPLGFFISARAAVFVP